MRILFAAFSNEIQTGARYAEDMIRRALSKKYEVKFVYPHLRTNVQKLLFPLIAAFIGYLPLFVRKRYALIITSDNFIFADIVYVQPPAGKEPILTCDEMVFGKNSYFRIPFLPMLTNKPIKSLVARHAHFITNSQYAREVVRKNYGKEASVIYPPVPTHLYGSLKQQRENLVVTISSLNPRKNLEMIAKVGIKVPEAKFMLIGYHKNEYAHILKEIMAGFEAAGLGKNFQYVPSASDEEKAEILSKARVYFHPTAYEPFGIGIAEGMAAGCTPVVHNSGGPKEFVPREWRYEWSGEACDKIRQALRNWNLKAAFDFQMAAYAFREGRFEMEMLAAVDALVGRLQARKRDIVN